MFDLKQCDELVKKLLAALPGNLQEVESELQQKFKEILQASFARFDLITREEFDVQVKVLARTREKLHQLEQQLESAL